MNTSFLSMFPPAPPPEQPQPARPAKSGKVAFEAGKASNEPDVNEAESTGDSDKADAFAEMLAAMISVATPPAETQVETVPTVAVESVTSSVTDVPRDGAGSPLFGASFTGSTPQVATSVATTTTTGPVDFMATAETMADSGDIAKADGTGQDGLSVLSEAAAAEFAAVGTETTEATPELVDSTEGVELAGKQVDETGNVETAMDAQTTVDSNLPIVDVNESTTVTSDDQTDLADAATDLTSVDRPVTSKSVKALTSESASDSGKSQTSDADLSKSEVVAPVETPVADTEGSVASEAHPVESQPVANADAVASAETVVVDEPYEEPQVAPTERNESSSAKPAGSRPTKSPIGQDSIGTTAPAQPEPTSAVTAVEPSSEVGVQKNVIGNRSEAPVESVHETAALTEAEALLATGTTGTEASNLGGVTSVVSSHTDSGSVSTPSHVSQQVLQALAAYEAELPQNGSRSFEMLLDPPELGRLLIQMSRTSKGVDVRISAENESVRSILETAGTEMQQDLQLSGFDLGQFSGSNSGGGFANGEEWVAAPTLQSFASTAPSPARPNTTHTTGSSAVNVVV